MVYPNWLMRMTAAVEAVDSLAPMDWDEDRTCVELILVKGAVEADDFFEDPAGVEPDITAVPKARAVVQHTMARTLPTVGFTILKSNGLSDLPNSQVERGIMIHTRPSGQSNCLWFPRIWVSAGEHAGNVRSVASIRCKNEASVLKWLYGQGDPKVHQF
jgi:hypothetical protein